ncbi:hypothetical protein MD484_g5675, partial [Candolleomyces efflorescens]
MRYTAVTCDPDQFEEAGFTLRQMWFDPPRETELLIGVTVSSEDEVELLSQTIYAVMKNIALLARLDCRRRIWGGGSWRKVVVCVVVDGVVQVDSGMLRVLAAMGVYREGLFKRRVGRREVMANVYEYTTPVAPSAPSLEIKLTPDSDPPFVPVQIVLCLKNQPQNKINSHQWLFNAFAPILKPFACILLGAGTVPGPTSFYQLWASFKLDPHVAVARGEVVPLDSSCDAIRYAYARSLVKYGDRFEWSIRYARLQYWPKGTKGVLQRYFEKAEKRESDGDGANIRDSADELILMREAAPQGARYWTSLRVKSAYAIWSTQA